MLLLATAPSVAAGDLRLADVFAHHMVLQQQSEVELVGFDAPGQQVSLRASWSDADITGVADEDGRFALRVRTAAAGGPYELSVHGSSELALHDVWLGEVWLCAGQSNMGMPIAPAQHPFRGVIDYPTELADGDHPEIRLFLADDQFAAGPTDSLTGSWLVCSPETIGRLCAVPYFFARELRRERDVAVGLLCATSGGSPLAAWMSRQSLADVPGFAEELAIVDRCRDDPDAAEALRIEQIVAWWDAVESADMDGEASRAPDCDDTGWQDITLPAPLESVLPGFDGVVWLRLAVDLPTDWLGHDLQLELGPVDDLDTTFFNGMRIGGTAGYGKAQAHRSYPVPGRLVQDGRNLIAVRVIDFWNEGGITDPLSPLRLERADGQGEPVSLRAPWRIRAGPGRSDIPRWPTQPPFHSRSPTALFNGLIAPLAGLPLKGVLFYQGESDVTESAQYRQLFPRLIQAWRLAAHAPELPFLFAQIAPFRYVVEGNPAPWLREAQADTLSVPHTGMVVTMDIGDEQDLHPRRKRQVGERFARVALADVYGHQDVVSRGPSLRDVAFEEGQARVRWQHVAGGLVTFNGQAPTCFRLAGADREFHDADAVIAGDAVILRSDAVAEPLAVRFAWGPFDTPNLRNAAGLPAAPFRTDDWEP